MLDERQGYFGAVADENKRYHQEVLDFTKNSEGGMFAERMEHLKKLEQEHNFNLEELKDQSNIYKQNIIGEHQANMTEIEKNLPSLEGEQGNLGAEAKGILEGLGLVDNKTKDISEGTQKGPGQIKDSLNINEMGGKLKDTFDNLQKESGLSLNSLQSASDKITGAIKKDGGKIIDTAEQLLGGAIKKASEKAVGTVAQEAKKNTLDHMNDAPDR